MSIKITIPNTSSDVLTFGSANTPTAAQIAGIDSGSSNGQLALYTTASGTSTERVRVDSSGNVGIGVTPSAWNSDYKPLQIGITSCVYGRVATNEAGLTQNLFRDTSGNFKYIGNGYAAVYTQLSGGGHAWYTAPNNSSGAGAALTITQAMTLDANGNLLVGTTSSDPTVLGARINASATIPQISVAVTTTSNNYLLYNTTAAAYRFFVTSAGVVNATTTTITAISDQRWKENIRDLDDGLEKVLALKPRKFDWKEGKGEDTKNARGFIAQELETVFPDMVTEWIDPAPDGEESYKAVNANLIPTLVKAIQEQQALITQLQADVAALKGASA